MAEGPKTHAEVRESEIEITPQMIEAAVHSLLRHLGELLEQSAYDPREIAGECLRSALSSSKRYGDPPDPTRAPEFQRTLKNLLNTPPKPHSAEPKRKRGVGVKAGKTKPPQSVRD